LSASNLSHVEVIVKDFSALLQLLPRLRRNIAQNPLPVELPFQKPARRPISGAAETNHSPLDLSAPGFPAADQEKSPALTLLRGTMHIPFIGATEAVGK